MTTASAQGFIPAIDLPVRLMIARNHAGMTQRQMAEAIGIGRATVANYEAGKMVRRAPVMAWALATGVDVKWLMTGEAPPSDDDGASGVVRPKGFEPLTSCSGEDQAVTWIDEYRDRRWVSSPVEAVPAAARMVG